MAKSRHITAKADVKAQLAVQQLLTTAVRQVEVQKKAVRVWSKLIAESMQEMHGGDWTFDIDHAAGFVLIRPSMRSERELA